jgi:hypothetical protein
MKTNKIIIAASIVAVFVACRKGDDLYINPNQPLNATPGTMLTAIEANTTMNYEGGLARYSSIFMQHQSGVVAQSQDIDRYSLTSSDMDNYWGGLYVGGMKNSKLLIDKFGSTNPYYGGIARVCMAINLGIATSLWGDVPYSEAFKLEDNVTQPKMDSQKDILNSIQTLLDLAIVDFNKPASANAKLPGADDILFNGNIPLWIKTAWTLKARYHNWLSKSDASGSAANVLNDLAKGITSNADNCYTSHNSAADPNQWAAFQDGRTYNSACKTLIDSMKNMTDPRTPWYFDTTGTKGIAVGNPIGTFDGGALLGPYLYNSAEDLRTPLVTYAEAQFLKAEAYARQSNSANALVELNKAIAASIDEVTKGAGKTYIVTSGTTNSIITEKWKAMFGQPLEAYADYRRTGFPNLTVRPGGVLNYIPKRFPVDLAESISNPNAVFIPLSTPVWFAK